MCLPCAKEVINHGAQAKVKQLKAFRQRLTRYIQHGRLKSEVANEFLRRSIACETAFIAEADLALDYLIDNLKEPWADGVSTDALSWSD